MSVGVEDCVVCQLTPAGRAAVATIAVSGAKAAERVGKLFRPAARKPLEQLPAGRIVFGRWGAEPGTGEELVVCRRGPDEVEIHCHGGRMAARMVVESLLGLGCREIASCEFAQAHVTDPIAADAWIALAATRTERAAAILLDQWRGALRDELREIVRRAESGASQDAADRLHALLRWSDVGLHLTRPWRVVLTGRTNVGKSSLINALLGYERSIVYGEPGTTRDVVTAHTAIDGWPVELADTAGLRASDDAVELAGVDLAHRVLAQADVVVLVFDASRPWLTDDASLVRDRPDALVVHNKCDQPMVDVAARPPGLSTSATEGRGVPEVVAALSHRLVPTPPPPGTAIPFTARQVEAIRAGLSALQAGRVGELTAALAEELTGCAGTWDGWG